MAQRLVETVETFKVSSKYNKVIFYDSFDERIKCFKLNQKGDDIDEENDDVLYIFKGRNLWCHDIDERNVYYHRGPGEEYQLDIVAGGGGGGGNHKEPITYTVEDDDVHINKYDLEEGKEYISHDIYKV